MLQMDDTLPRLQKQADLMVGLAKVVKALEEVKEAEEDERARRRRQRRRKNRTVWVRPWLSRRAEYGAYTSGSLWSPERGLN